MNEELININDALGVLQEYKGSKGHKAMVEIAHQKMSYYMAEFMDGKDVDLVQNRANFKAWKELVNCVDERIFEYEGYIGRVLEEQNRQAQMAQRGMV